MELLHVVALLAALVVLLALVLAAIASTFQPVHPDGLLRGFRRRSLAIELARDYCEVAAILGARIELPCDFSEVATILVGTRSGWNRSVMRILQIADFLFIAVYAALLVLGAVLLAYRGLYRGFPYAPWLGVAAGACGVLGVLCDLFKNASIGDMLRLRRSDPAEDWNTVIARTRKRALYKWFLVFCAAFFSAVFFFIEPFGWIWLPGTCLAAAASYGLYVLARRDKDKDRESGLEAAVSGLYLGIVLGAVGLLWLAFPSVVSVTASVIMDSIRFAMRIDDGV